jgi:hypothetical protein
MSRARVEELTAKLLDGEIGDAELAELDALVDGDPEARRVHVALLELEHGLWAELAPIDVSEATLRGLREREARVSDHVTAAVRARARGASGRAARAPSAAQAPAPRRRAIWWAVAAGAAAAASLVVAVAGRRGDRVATPAPTNAARAGAYATVTRAVGAEVVRRGAGDARAVTAGDALAPVALIRVGGGGAFAARLDDGAAIEAGPNAELALDGDVAAAAVERRLRLARGRLEASVPVQPDDRRVVFTTPHARATVLGTRLVLDVSAAGTRLDVVEGLVLLEGLRDRSAREVAAGQSALIAAEAPAPPRTALAPPDGRPASGEPVALFRWDFEGDARPAGFTHGELIAGGEPDRPCRSQCLMGTINPHAAMTYTVGYDKPGGPLLAFTDSTIIEFDYWVGPEAQRLALQLESRRFGKNYGVRLTDVVRQAWAHAVVRLADFRPYDDTLPRFQGGDLVDSLLIMGGRIGGQPLYLDNLAIREAPPGSVPEKSTASAPPR